MGKGNWKCKVSVSTSDNTDTSMKVKATCIWDSNDWSYDMNGITGWVYINGHEYEVYSGSIDCSSGNTKTLGSKTVTINKTHSSQTIPCYAKIKSTSSYSSGTETSGTTNKTVSAKTSYTVSYNANGGSSTPSNQTKWYGENLTLASAITRTGYSFAGWNTNNSGTGTNYSAGGTYSGNAGLTLYAKWTPNTYTVSYNANGGSGAPGNQTKTYGVNLTLSSTTPTRTGYTFNGWSGSDGNIYWPSGTYTGNSALTLTARWTEITYTVSYNANGGSGAPGNQTKYYTSNLTLSSTRPTRTNYNFKGWSTTSTGNASYQPGGIYSNNANITLYAVWELAYIKPRITNFTAYRCNEDDGAANESGTSIKVIAHWETDKSVGTSISGSSIKIRYGLSTASSLSEITVTPDITSTSGDIDIKIGSGNIDIENSYVVQVYVNDVTGYNETSKYPIPSVSFPIDIKKYGRGVAFGGVAKEDNVMDVNFKARFNQGQKMWRTDNTGNAARWHYLGQIQINDQGNYAHFKIFGGAGQNATTNQNMLMDITLKKGWQSTPSTSNYVGVVYNVYAMNDSRYKNIGTDIKVKVMCHTIGYADVYVYFSWAYSTIRYTVDGEFDSFIRGTQLESDSEPTEGVEQPCIGGVIPVIYNGDLLINRSFRIPKNPTDGYGITNADGISIIRDHNNGCVTVDATNDWLYLGWAHTNGINILNGKISIGNTGHMRFNDGNNNCCIGANNGSIYLRPKGPDDSTNQFNFASDGQLWVNNNICFNGEYFLKGYSNGSYINLLRAANGGMCCLGDSAHVTGIWGSYVLIQPSSIRFNGFGSGVNAITGSGNILYLGNGSEASGKSTYLRGNTVRLYSHSGTVYLGSSGSTAVTSDEQVKELFDINDKYINFYNNLKPTLYKYTTPTGGNRLHIGFGARQVEKSLKDAGLTNDDFAGIVRDENVDICEDEWGEKGGKHFDVFYSLKYEEFIALNTKMVQRCLTKITELENIIKELKEKKNG